MKEILLLSATILLISGNVWADDDIISGNDCGKTENDHCSWSLNTKTGELIISGTGQMADYEYITEDGYLAYGYHDGGTNTRYSTAPWATYSVSSIKVEEGITSVGNGAFFAARARSVSLPEGLTSIGNDAFMYTSFTDVTLPTTLTSIGKQAFHGGRLKSLTIPESVTEIGRSAFNANYITDVEIPLNLTSLMYHVFSSNPIKTLFIPDNVTDIDKYAFYCEGCSSTLSGRAMPLEAIYCTEAQMEQCAVAASYLNAEPTMYSKDSNGNLYVYDSKGNVVGKYASLDALKGKSPSETYKYDSAGHLVGIFDGNGQRTWGKKIYTVEEAMEVTKNGDKFHVMLTYK